MDKWLHQLQPSEGQRKVPTVFYLHCNQKTMIDALWYNADHFHADVTEEYSVCWKIKGRNGDSLTVRVCRGPLPLQSHTKKLDMSKHTEVMMEPKRRAHTVPYLKSHLQKCIRKGNTALALSTANAFFDLDHYQCIRRLSIIMVEDVELHPTFNILLWWTMVFNKDQNKHKHIKHDKMLPFLKSWMLGVVRTLCDHHLRRFIDVETVRSLSYNTPLTPWEILKRLYAWKEDTFAPHDVQNLLCNTIYSLVMRISYGGLSGDVSLLQYVAHYYLNFLTDTNAFKQHLKQLQVFWYQSIDLVDKDILSPLRLMHWDLDAVDFHIAPNLLTFLTTQCLMWQQDNVNVKRMMWENGSAVNVRDLKDDKKYNDLLWRRILPSLRKEQTRLLYLFSN